MARTFTAHVIVKDQRFKPGDEVPSNLDELVGAHVTQGVTSGGKHSAADSGQEEVDSYDQLTKDELRAEVDGRELDVPANALKADLIAALEADDEANPDE